MAGRNSEIGTAIPSIDGTERQDISRFVTPNWVTNYVTPLLLRAFYKKGGKPNPTIYSVANTYYPTNVQPSSSNATQAVSANMMYFTPFAPGKDVTLSELLCRVSTAGAAGKLGRMAIYLGDPDTGAPVGLPLYDSGTFAVDTTGLKTFNPALSIKCGEEYHLAFWSDGTPTMNAYTPLPLCGIRLTSTAINTLGGLCGNQAFGAWPNFSGATLTTGSAQGTIFPAVCCK